MPSSRINIKAILADPTKRKTLMVDTIIATQAREGITTTRVQAEAAYDKVTARLGAPAASSPSTPAEPTRTRG